MKFNVVQVKTGIHMVIGCIDELSNGRITGWLGGTTGEVIPFITVNNKPCHLIGHALSRPDVAAALGLDESVGFAAELPHLPFGDLCFRLYSINEMGTVKLIAEKSFAAASNVPLRISSIFDALKIAKQPRSVAITCWDGTHNPIGRAKVLFDVLKNKRPAVIFAFDFHFAEQSIWPPILDADVKIVIIPWEDRERYFLLFKSIGLHFETIWICKNRYPSYELAKNLASPSSRFIQDIDDNEEKFSSADDLKTLPYGNLSYFMAHQFLNKIPHRTVVSQSLQHKFGGEILRHLRTPSNINKISHTDSSKEIKIGFFGTIRPHKKVIEIAKTLRLINQVHGCNFKFIVGGIYDPISLKEQLVKLGANVFDAIDSSRLNGFLSEVDLVITGFPASNSESDITDFHVSSKISDALALGLPVLVPESPSVDDLKNVHGVFLFNHDNFFEQLKAASASTVPISLPDQFSLDAGLKIFENLERKAKQTGLSYHEIFGVTPNALQSFNVAEKNVVLVWKQHDSGLYGRRVDQLARSLVKSNKFNKVRVLELITDEQIALYAAGAIRIDSDHQFIFQDQIKKQAGFYDEGVLYHSLELTKSKNTLELINDFLLNKTLFPHNTVFIIFPAITEFTYLLKAIEGYSIICDIVDNQISWSLQNPLPLLHQYAQCIAASEKVIFNSEVNRDYFISRQLCEERKTHLIPNWYSLPNSFNVSPKQVNKQTFDIIYSGNMNDRIDWDLLVDLEKEMPNHVRIHLIGSADRVLDKLENLLSKSSRFIYHGPLRERQLLAHLANSDLTIMPHTLDRHSHYMNPLKLSMYKSLGLHCITTAVDGIEVSETSVTRCSTSKEFINQVLVRVTSPSRSVPSNPTSFNSYFDEYLSVIEGCLPVDKALMLTRVDRALT